MAHHYHNPSPAPAISWVPAVGNYNATSTAVVGGFDINGETLYVGRALHDSGDLIPGKVVPSHGVCYVAWGSREHAMRNYQVLNSRPGVEMIWIPSSGPQIPTGAVQAGVTTSGEPLFIGRHEHEGSYVIGKIQPSHEVLYVSFNGEEVPYRDFEILCLKHMPL